MNEDGSISRQKNFEIINPNTRTCPIIRTRIDAALLRKFYDRTPVLMNEQTGHNPWGASTRQGLFNMTSDSNLFERQSKPDYVRLYEAKMFHQFDHRWSTYTDTSSKDCDDADKANPHFVAQSRYWVKASEVKERLAGWDRDWLLAFRDITRPIQKFELHFSRFFLGRG